jgi:hypothetical protein
MKDTVIAFTLVGGAFFLYGLYVLYLLSIM